MKKTLNIDKEAMKNTDLIISEFREKFVDSDYSNTLMYRESNSEGKLIQTRVAKRSDVESFLKQKLDQAIKQTREAEKQKLIKSLKDLQGACSLVCWYTHTNKDINPHVAIWQASLEEKEKE